MRFFFDNNISRQIARGIAEFALAQDIEIVHLRDRWDPSILDVEWIPALHAEGDWIIVSGDLRITRSRVEQRAWHESGLTAFFFEESFAQKRFWTQAAEITRWFPIIIDTARDCAPGSGFKLPSQGKDPKQIYTPTS